MTNESGSEIAGAVEGGGEAGILPIPVTTARDGDPLAL